MRRVAALIGSTTLIAAIVLSSAVAASALVPGAGAGHPHRHAPLAHRASAAASVLQPALGQVLTGVSCGSAGVFAGEVGKHPAVYGEFVTWGQSIHWAFNDAAAAHALLMLHISTAPGLGAREVITPAAIAAGDGDAYLLSLSQLIASRGAPVYIRLFPEMNNAHNDYSAYNLDGSSRGASHSQPAFIAAWRRVVAVLRGGPVASIDLHLQALGLPRLHGIATGAALPRPPIAFVWTPETAGTPAIAGNDPRHYYPGDRYVDWVGTDFYSSFPNFTGLDAFYKDFPGKPFAFGEWALWGSDNPAFVNQLFAWVDSHRRTQMMLYNQGYSTSGPFALNLYPGAAQAIRTQLAGPRFLAFSSTH